MMKKITSIICAFVSVVSFADAYQPAVSVNPSQLFTDMKLTASEPNELKEGLFYVRFIASDPTVFTQFQVHPGVGVGYRRMRGSSAFDISATTGGRGGNGLHAYTWTVPKVSYLHYLNPLSEQTMYLGAGMAFGGVESKRVYRKGLEKIRESHDFVGLLGHITVGAEWLRRDTCVVMTELSVSQPLIAANSPKKLSGPSAELSCGLGF